MVEYANGMKEKRKGRGDISRLGQHNSFSSRAHTEYTTKDLPRQDPGEVLRALYGRRKRLYGLVDLRKPVWGSAKELEELLEKEPDIRLDICPQRLYPGCTNKKENIACIQELAIDIDNPSLTKEELMRELRRLRLPTPYAVLKTPHGFHIHWRLRRPIQLTPRPRDSNESWVDRWDYFVNKYQETSRALCRALEHLGADKNSENPARLWRVTQVEIVSLRKGKTSLWELHRAAKRSLPRPVKRRNTRSAKAPTTPTYTRREREERTSSPPPGSKSPVIGWLKERTVYEGSRNKAVTALAIALLREGKSPQEVIEEISTWASEHTVPTYPEEEIRWTVKSLARRNFNISPRKLKEIKTDKGTIPDELVKGLWKVKPTHVRKELERRIKKPRVWHLLAVLKGEEHKIPRSSRYLLRDLVSYVRGVREGRDVLPLYVLGFGQHQFLLFLAKKGLWPTEAHSVNSIAFWMREEPEFGALLLRAAAELLCSVRGRVRWERWRTLLSREEAWVDLSTLGTEGTSDEEGRWDARTSQGSVCLGVG